MQAIFELFFQFSSVQLKAQQEQVEKKQLMMSCRQAGLEEKHPTSLLGEKTNEAVYIEQFWKLHSWVILWGGNPSLEAPVVEQDLLVDTP